jgi:hypothetical protein
MMDTLAKVYVLVVYLDAADRLPPKFWTLYILGLNTIEIRFSKYSPFFTKIYASNSKLRCIDYWSHSSHSHWLLSRSREWLEWFS